MAQDWYELILKTRAKKLIANAQQNGLDFPSFMKEAAKTGVSNDVDVLNYARLLKEDQNRKRSAEMQQGITSAVTAARQPPTSEQDLSQMRQTMTPEQYATTLASDTTKYLGSAPKTEEQFMGAMGRQQLPAEATFSDVQANPAFNFAKGELLGNADELAAARLKVQQDDLARKQKQIDEKNRLGDIRSTIAANELAFKRYKLGIGTQESWLDRADDTQKEFQKTANNLIELEGREKKLKKIISAGADEEGNILTQDQAEEAKNQLAEVETLLIQGEVQKKALADRVKQLTSEAYSQGEKVSKQSPKAFKEPGAEKPVTTPRMPGTLGGKVETREERRARLGY